ncbi:DNA polymerase III subunit gamma/tau [Acidicapsa ligni]|uniref:DNA polymerase III subunit gamma/tau n=1 Tax=Acidicapsa ligni TaxID=542300 RepID=UPI0021E03270|nr:DNA polymerase III subunit gamma/tau [Acidicapsa ligni]
MGYQVLARKYRPQRFADVAGQDHVTRTLTNALTQQRIAHGYIFSGHRGIGKTTIARILAQALNCRNVIGSDQRPTAEPCGVCDSCIEIRQGNAVDVIEIDAATNRGIDEIRELRDAARYSPSRDRYKIYILDEAHQITDAAFNALLKTLEEPPAHVIFMMATTEPESIPQTIRSRCQHFSFHAVKFDDIFAQLKAISLQEDVITEDAALALLAEAGDGSMRDALSIMDQAIASAPVENGKAVLQTDQIRELMGSVPNAVFERLMEAVSAQQSARLMEDLDKLLASGNSPSALARQMVRYLRNCLMAKLGGENTGLLEIAYDERARAARTALLFTEEELTRNLQIVLRTFDELNYRQEQRFHLELGLLKLIQAQRLLPMEEILSGLASQASPGTRRPSAPAASPARNASQPSSPQSAPASRASAPAAAPAPPAAPSLSPFAQSNQRSADVSTSRSSAPVRDVPNASSSREPLTQSLREPGVTPISQSPSPLTPIAVSNYTLGSVSETLTEGSLARVAVATPEEKATQSKSEQTGQVESSSPETKLEIVPDIAAEIPAPIASMPAASMPAAPEPTAAKPIAQPAAPPIPVDTIASSAAPSPAIATPAATAISSADEDRIAEVRSAVAQALEAGGHATAATLIDDGKWTIEASSVRIEVGAKATMIRLTFNAAAEKFIRQGLTQAGAPTRFMIVPGENPTSSSSTSRRAPQGSVDAEARQHPLVLKAQELFKAEVVSVVDLREK